MGIAVLLSMGRIDCGKLGLYAAGPGGLPMYGDALAGEPFPVECCNSHGGQTSGLYDEVHRSALFPLHCNAARDDGQHSC